MRESNYHRVGAVVCALISEALNMGRERTSKIIDPERVTPRCALVWIYAAKGNGQSSALCGPAKERLREKALVASWKEQLCTAAGILVALHSCPSACRQPCNVRIAVHGLGGHGHLHAWPLS